MFISLKLIIAMDESFKITVIADIHQRYIWRNYTLIYRNFVCRVFTTKQSAVSQNWNRLGMIPNKNEDTPHILLR